MNYLRKNILTYLMVAFAIVSCEKEKKADPVIAETPIVYSFFVAGHTYGNPNVRQYGLHPPFVNAIPYVNAYRNMSLGILTGDVVASSTVAYWDSATLDIDKITVPVHIAAGNHDRSPVFNRRYKEYYSFIHEKDLFIILSPTSWNIEGPQQTFLVETIEENRESVQNIFIFCHELIWWSQENKFKNVKINYVGHYPEVPTTGKKLTLC